MEEVGGDARAEAKDAQASAVEEGAQANGTAVKGADGASAASGDKENAGDQRDDADMDLDGSGEDKEDDMEGKSDAEDMDKDESSEDAEAAELAEMKEKAAGFKEAGNAKYKVSDFYGAMDLYNLAIRADPENSAYYLNRAAAELMLNLTAKTIISCQKCLGLEPGNLKAQIRLGKAYLRLGEATKALASFKAVLALDPTNASAFKEKREAQLLDQRITRAREEMEAGNVAKALQLAQAGLRQAPDCRELNLIRTRGLLEAGDYDQAYSLTTKLMRDDQNDAQLLSYRAKCLYFQENFANAVRHLQQALQLDPDNRECQLDIRKIRKLERLKESGNAHFKAGRYAQAIEDYAACLQVDPANKSFCAKLHCNRAAALQKLRRDAEAVADCDAAIKLNPDYGKAFMRRAACLRAVGGKDNIEMALHSYTEAERIVGRSQELAQSVRDTKRELKVAKRKDYWMILGLENRERSSTVEIKKAYKKKALMWHPDRHAKDTPEDQVKAEAMFKDVGEAYEVLSTPEKRSKYEAGQSLEEIEQGGPSMGQHDPNDIFQMFFNQQRGGHSHFG